MIHSLLLASVALEAAAVVGAVGGLGLPLVCLLHLTSALAGAAWSVRLLSPAFQRASWAFPLFWAALVSFPVIGLPGLLLGLVLPLRRPRAARGRPPGLTISLLPAQAFHPDSTVLARPGGSAARRRARDTLRRVQAVGATRNWPDAQALPLLREALRDPADDVRLLAYALLQHRERHAADRVRRCDDELRADPSARTRLRAAEARLAFVVDAHVHGVAAARASDAALGHCDAGLLAAPDDARLHFVRGRLLLARGDPEAAQASFEAAASRGLPFPILAPYLARARFESRAITRPEQNVEHLRRTRLAG